MTLYHMLRLEANRTGSILKEIVPSRPNRLIGTMFMFSCYRYERLERAVVRSVKLRAPLKYHLDTSNIEDYRQVELSAIKPSHLMIKYIAITVR